MTVAATACFAESPRAEIPGLSALREGRGGTVDGAGADADNAPVEGEDQRDIRLSLGGDGEAYRRLVLRYQDRIAAWVLRLTRRRDGLEERVQDVFVEAYFSLPKYRDRGALSGWLYRIATRVVYRHWKEWKRESSRRVALEDLDAPAGVRDAARPPEAADRLAELMRRLSPRNRMVLTLRYLEDKSVAETADLLGWSRTLVKVQTYRARGELRRALADAGYGPGENP